MSNIPSANQKIQIEATQYRAPVSESLAQTMGGSINYALDQVATNATNITTVSNDLASLESTLSGKSFEKTLNIQKNGPTIVGDASSVSSGSLVATQTYNFGGSRAWYINVQGECLGSSGQSYIEITIDTGDFGEVVAYKSGGELGSGDNQSSFSASVVLPIQSPILAANVRVRVYSCQNGFFNRRWNVSWIINGTASQAVLP